MRILLLFIVLLAPAIMLAQSVKVMSYNIRLDTEADGLNQWKNRPDKVIGLIKKYDPDLFGVQEAMHNQMLDLQSGLSEYSYAGVGRDDGKEKGEYSAIFYKKEKFELLTQNTDWLSETPDVPGSKSWDAAITRVFTYALFKDKSTGKNFFYGNTHFDHIGKEARKNSANLIKYFIAGFIKGASSQKEIKLPVIISGDFNSEPIDAPYLTITNGEIFRLYDSRPATNLTGTFCGFEINKIKCRTIDYIFHSEDWKASGYQVIQDNDGNYYPSDHLPVFVTLSLK
ncbi:MAG: endonuclease/exonuclease/phosphatase family protein [Cyclobacteriaceae bacterium]|nr:MAG: endonuclease/exonuclease/phosphatase family protein [Cyclobacteriaceae bacterium]